MITMREADPYFQDISWDLIYDESGKLIGEVYVLLPAKNQKGA